MFSEKILALIFFETEQHSILKQINNDARFGNKKCLRKRELCEASQSI